MDPLSQAAIGAAAAQATFGRKLPRSAWWLGALAGMTPDLDTFIPAADATAGWVHHRGFTHSLAFAPVGGAICAAAFLLISKSLRRSPWAVLGACVLGVLTHAPLDALTTYGTQLYWPFTRRRAALDWMPIIDPIWTLTLWAFVIVAIWKKSPRPAIVGLVVAGLYIGFGAYQHQRGVWALRDLAQSRGHEIERLRVMPSPASLALWRGVYVDDGVAYAAALRTGYLSVGPAQVRDDARSVTPANSRQVLTAADMPSNPEAQRQFDIFDWFADGLVVAADPAEPLKTVDGRYGGDAGTFAGLWGVDFTTTPPSRFRPERGFDVGRTLRAKFNLDGDYRDLDAP